MLTAVLFLRALLSYPIPRLLRLEALELTAGVLLEQADADSDRIIMQLDSLKTGLKKTRQVSFLSCPATCRR